MIAATAMFAVSNGVAKLMTASYPVGEIMFSRSMSSFLCGMILVVPVSGLSVFRTRIPKAHLARGLSQSVSQTFTVIALSMMPLAGATAIGFTAPLFAALVAILVLREAADTTRLAALAAGFVGALVVVRPGSDSFNMGAAFALANALMYGSVMVAVRRMSRTESTMTLLVWQLATVAGFHSLLLAFGFKVPTPADAALLFASGAVNAMGQLLWTRALALAPATTVAPYYYTLVLWSGLVGFLIWGDTPTIGLALGSAIIAGSGFVLAVSESRAKKASADPAVAVADAAITPRLRERVS
jgi:drug/metabolite transporter (DMT)-like permease